MLPQQHSIIHYSLCYILLLFVTPILSQGYTELWYDKMGSSSKGDWTMTNNAEIAFDSADGHCQNNLCARIWGSVSGFNYMKRVTDVSLYSSIRLQLYVEAVGLESFENDQCEVWYKYGDGAWTAPTNGVFTNDNEGVVTIDIESSSEPILSIALEISADSETDECFFDNIYFYGVPITNNPTKIPTKNPTPAPTVNPTPAPTKLPTTNPTPAPTINPTPAPTDNPTTAPTNQPTLSPTDNPTPSPTNIPTPAPTDIPSPAPTNNPTLSTKTPSMVPTSSPTAMPTPAPTINPTSAPTLSPSKAPTNTVLVIQRKPTIAPIIHGETTKSAQNNNGNTGNNDKSSEQNGSNEFILNLYYVVIIGSILIICCVAIFWWLYCLKKKRPKQKDQNPINVMNAKPEQGNIANIEVQRVYSATAEEFDDYNLMITPIGPSPVTPIGPISTDIPPIPTENNNGESDNDDNMLYGHGATNTETSNGMINNAPMNENENENEDDNNVLYGATTIETPNGMINDAPMDENEYDDDEENEENDEDELYWKPDNGENEHNVTTTGK